MEQRVGIIEMLWEVAYADGVLDPHEDMLLRQIAGLIHVPDRERGLARKRALESWRRPVRPAARPANSGHSARPKTRGAQPSTGP